VDLVPQLEAVRSLGSLSGVVAALGHEPLLEAAPGVVGRPGADGDGAALVVGRAGAFPWFAVAGPDPERLARRVARRLATRGRLGGVLAFDSAGRRLGVAVAFDGAPSLVVDLDRPAAAALACLRRLAGAGPGGALAYAARAADALSGEAVGRRFFREFKATLDRMAEGLPTPLRGEERRSLALLQLTRVLFLYFVQSKGWLAGRDRFLSEEVDRCLARRRRIHRDLLRPLFFGTLNRPAAERSRTAGAFGAIPFLNGGLFEPHPLERSLRGDIPNPIWRDAFDRLFERFHFIVSEGGQTGGIAPDMLGRVFEGVMAPSTRRASGSYYTPAPLVRSILDAALAALAAGRLGCSEAEAERRLIDRDPGAAALLDDLTVLDPAAGSGAFLLGALERLSSLAAPDGVASAPDRRRILQRTLFGVDRSSAAVRLTELRLWLAVIAQDREDRPERVEPLPNLDCLIRQGDTLFEPVGGQVRLRAPDAGLAKDVAELRRQLVTASGQRKRELVRALRAAECRAAEASLEAAESEARARVAECLSAARSEDLFGGRRGADAEVRARLADNRAELRALRGARRTLVREREVPWFHYQSHFADVFAGGGFDIVVGNPPWLRAEEVPPEMRRRLEGRYRWWRGAGRGFGHRPDLAVAFLERAVELAAPGGIAALLVPAKLATAGYGAAARHALAASTTLIHAADLTGQRVAAFDATVYPLALVVRKAPPPAGHRVRTSLGPRDPTLLAGPSASGGGSTTGAGIPQSRLGGGGPWILSANGASTLATRLRREHPVIGDRFTCQLGLKTGANHLFLDPPATIAPWLVRWAVRGRDVRAFRPRARVRLLWTHGPDGAPLDHLPPAAAAHLAPHETLLRARADFAGGPAWTLFRTRAATARHRVVWSDLARRLTACALTGRRDGSRIPLNSCYVAAAASAEQAERLTAWLNACWVGALAQIGAMPAAGGFHRFAAAVVSGVPLPQGVLADESLSAIAVAGWRGEPVQEALDEIAAGHLGLSPRDRRTLGRLVGDGTADRR
jgi:Eco57I restriction-modification methylase